MVLRVLGISDMVLEFVFDMVFVMDRVIWLKFEIK